MTRSRVVLLAAITCLLILGIVLFVLLRGSSVDQLRDLYNVQAAASRAASWPRPGLPPGEQELLEGSSAADYHQAWEVLDSIALDRADTNILTEHLTDPTEPPDYALPDGDPLEAPCAALGITPALHARLSELDGTLCDRLKAAQPALQLVETGSRRRNGDSPVRLTDPWAYPAGKSRPPFHFLQLGHLLLLQAAMERAQEQEASADRRLSALLRFSDDLEHGGGLVSAILGSELRSMAAAAIYVSAQRGELSDRALERLSESLSWELKLNRFEMHSILRDELLLTTPLLLTEAELEGFELLIPRDNASLALGGSGGLLEGFWRRDMLRTYHKTSLEQLTLDPPTFAARIALSDRQELELGRSLNPLTQILASTSSKLYEARLLQSWSQLALLLATLSDLRYQRAQGKPAPDAAALREVGLPVLDDPLTQRSLRWVQDGDDRRVCIELPPELELTLTSTDQLKERQCLTLLGR